MGYRSEIGILVTLPRGVKAKTMVEKLFSKWDKEDFENVFEVKERYEEFNYVYIHSKYDIKWYDTCYEDVKATMNFIRDFENHYKTGGIHFVRIGENNDDLEEEYKGDCERIIEVQRYMATDFD